MIEVRKKKLDLPKTDRKTFMAGAFTGMKRAMARAERIAKSDFDKSGMLKVRSGRLRASIGHRVERRGREIVGILGAGVKYARIHELGGTIKPKTAPYLHFQVRGQWVKVKEVTIPARPYLRPPLDPRIISPLIEKAIFEKVMR